ncbi:MAG: virulence RhuM family protein [Bryobacteraceae bacterium]
MSEGELVLYRTRDGVSEIQLRAVDGTVWLTQAQMAELFQTSPQAITQLIKSIYRERELAEEATCKSFLQVREEGGRQIHRALKSYRLEMILAVGFRVRSDRGTQFRQWATTALNEYLVKGFVINDRRLRDRAGFDYFDELLERIRDIRASEKRFYQKVRDLFAETSADYDSQSDTAQVFFKTIQNKMLFAVTGHTAAELIVSRASADQPNMGLFAWKGARVRKADVTVAKNYLNREEISELNRIVTMFLDFAEDQAKRRKEMTMTSWIAQTDRFLAFHERNVLGDAGRVSHERMEEIALYRYDAFDAARRERETSVSDAEAIDELKRIAADARSAGAGEEDE